MSIDKEKTSKDSSTEGEGYSNDFITLKNDVAQAYIDKISSGGFYFGSLIIGKGDLIKDYLVSESIFDKISDGVKGKFLFQPFIKPLLSETIQYSGKNITIGEYLEQAKKELDNAHTEIELNNLKSKIIDKSDLVDQAPVDSSEQQEQADNFETKDEIDNKTDNGSNFKKLIVGSTGIIAISQIEIDYINNERAKIEKNIDIKGNFADIKKIENSEGKKILECKGETPYIHKDVIKDLVGLSLLFYKKTGDELTLESSYRTIEQQTRLKKEKPNLAAEPGKSGHNLGLSIDITESDRYSKKIGGVAGLKEMAAKFNFNPISNEDRHFDHGELPNPDSRPQLAQNLDNQFEDLKLAA